MKEIYQFLLKDVKIGSKHLVVIVIIEMPSFMSYVHIFFHVRVEFFHTSVSTFSRMDEP